MSRSLEFFSGRDNEQDVVLLSDNAPVDPSGITRVVVEAGGKSIDSAATPALFDWPVSGTWNGAAVNLIRLNFGAATLALGRYEDGKLIIYDATYPDGLVWMADIVVSMRG